jgi:hypothetical protein
MFSMLVCSSLWAGSFYNGSVREADHAATADQLAGVDKSSLVTQGMAGARFGTTAYSSDGIAVSNTTASSFVFQAGSNLFGVAVSASGEDAFFQSLGQALRIGTADEKDVFISRFVNGTTIGLYSNMVTVDQRLWANNGLTINNGLTVRTNGVALIEGELQVRGGGNVMTNLTSTQEVYVISYTGTTIRATASMGQSLYVALTNNASVGFDLSTYPTNFMVPGIAWTIDRGTNSVTWDPASISTNASSATPPGSANFATTNNYPHMFGFGRSVYNTNVMAGVQIQ